VPLALVESDPIRALGLVLRRRARPDVERSPSELFDIRRTVDPATADWIEVGRRALLATRSWTGPTVGNLEPTNAWHVLAEIAALAEAVAVLDTDLCATAGERADVHPLLASTSGLRLAAREVLALAAPDDQPRPGPAELASAPQPVISPAEGIAARNVRPSTLAKDTCRLTILLDESAELSPHHIRACAQVARNLCVLAARSATSFTGADLRQELGAVARALHGVVTRARGEFAVNPVVVPALEFQLRDLHASTRRAFAGGVGLEPADANRVARRLPDLVEILGERTDIQIERGNWMLPDRRDGERLPYAFAERFEPSLAPPMLGHLAAAAAGAVVLRDQTADASTVGHDSQRAVAAQVSLYGLIQRASVRTAAPCPDAPAQGPGCGGDPLLACAEIRIRATSAPGCCAAMLVGRDADCRMPHAGWDASAACA
jgi:hypothetical protein